METKNKTPYEIRLEILNLAQSYTMDQWQQTQYWIEKQCTLLDDMMNAAKKDTNIQLDALRENYEETTKKMNTLIASYPTEEMVLETAKKFQEFVNNKRS
jgi:hypothetical protein